jgi:hypothetical protein
VSPTTTSKTTPPTISTRTATTTTTTTITTTKHQQHSNKTSTKCQQRIHLRSSNRSLILVDIIMFVNMNTIIRTLVGHFIINVNDTDKY